MSQFTQKPKIIELFKQSYKPLMSWVRPDKVAAAVMPFLSCGATVKHINMKAIGRCMVEGVEMEFADVRVYAVMPESQEDRHE